MDTTQTTIKKNLNIAFEQSPIYDQNQRHTFRKVSQDQENTSWLQPLIRLVADGFSFIGQRAIKTFKPEITNSSHTTINESALKRSYDEVYHDALTQEQWDKKYRKIALPGNSNQLMQWVVFNDKTNSQNLGVSKKPMGENQIKQLKDILSDLIKHYPDNTPTVHLVYEIFQPELLDQGQKENIHTFFKNLETTHNNLRVIHFCDIKEKAEYGKTATDLRLQIIKQENTGLRKKLWLLQDFDKLMSKDIITFNSKYGYELDQLWPNMLKKNPWLRILNGQNILNAYDTKDSKQIKIFDEFKNQLDNLTPAQLQNIEVCVDPQPLMGTAKALYVDLQRCVLLNDSDLIQDSSSTNGSLIYRDFDTTMSAAMPDITLKPNEILGVPDHVKFDSFSWMLPVCDIVENAVMGVACPKNPTIKAVIEKAKSEVIESDHPESLQENQHCINNYNYIYTQLSGKLITPNESTFSHSKTGSLKCDSLS